ncbi:MAG TPA: hypothetical protein VFK04_12890 [Gemmatimonadaceae bacterium]|nr:hypothetical protein [Gemmatimonadaceae bacterium]
MSHDTRRHDVAALAIAAFGAELRELAAEMERGGLPEAWTERVREVDGRVRGAQHLPETHGGQHMNPLSNT